MKSAPVIPVLGGHLPPQTFNNLFKTGYILYGFEGTLKFFQLPYSKLLQYGFEQALA